MAHPVGASTPEDTRENLNRAGLWLRWLRDHEPDRVVIAPWLGPLLAGHERDDVPEDRRRGLRDCAAVAARCDGIVLVGGRVSEGMNAERRACVFGGGLVADLTVLGVFPPTAVQWARVSSAAGVMPIALGMLHWKLL